MKEFLKSVVSTATFKQSSITFSGTFINGLLGALFYILTARFLGPADFGILIIAITSLTLVADISELGVGTGLVRFVSGFLSSQKEKAYRFLKLGLEIKIILAGSLAILGWLVAREVAIIIFQKEALAAPLRLAFLGVSGMILFTFSVHAFQSFQKFWHWSAIQISINALRLLIIIWFINLGQLNLTNSLITYISMPFIGFVASLFFLPKQFLHVNKEHLVLNQFFHYSKWVALFTLIAAISARLDTFISARLLSTTEVGFYGAATQLVTVIPQIVASLHTVVSPKMAAMGSKQDLTAYMKKVQLLTLALAGAILIASPLVVFLIPFFYGSAYAGSVPSLFIILLLAMLIFLISVPIHMSVFYYFSYPQLFVWISVGHLAIIAILGWHLISLYGAIGAAVTVLVGTIFNFAVPLIWVLRRLKNG